MSQDLEMFREARAQGDATLSDLLTQQIEEPSRAVIAPQAQLAQLSLLSMLKKIL